METMAGMAEIGVAKSFFVKPVDPQRSGSGGFDGVNPVWWRASVAGGLMARSDRIGERVKV